MARSLIIAVATLAAGLAGPALAESPPGSVTDVLLLTCLTPAEQARIRRQRRSLVVLPTAERGAIYEVVLLEGRWLLLFHASPDEFCIVDQGSKIDFNPNLRGLLSEIPATQ